MFLYAFKNSLYLDLLVMTTDKKKKYIKNSTNSSFQLLAQLYSVFLLLALYSGCFYSHLHPLSEAEFGRDTISSNWNRLVHSISPFA